MLNIAASRRLALRTVSLSAVLLISASWYATIVLANEIVVVNEEEGVAPPAGQMTLDQAIEFGLQNQPALAAARASLAAAYSGQRGVEGIQFGRILSRDLPIRLQQACLGVSIAAAGLEHAEWETRYAVRRTFYSVKYARMQQAVVDEALRKIDDSYRQAEKLIGAGDPKFKVTRIDLDVLKINKEFVRTRKAEADVGILKAFAGLREALGVGPKYKLEIVDEPLPPYVESLNKDEMIAYARANRSELSQAMNINRVTELEIDAQRKKWFSFQNPTFAAGSDIHAKPIPQGIANGEYRPGAIGPEMPPFLIGKRQDRMQRAADLNDRSVAVVAKTENLIELEVEATCLKWLEAAQNVKNLAPTPGMAKKVADDVRLRFDEGNVTGEEMLRARTLEEQALGMYNQALFQHALALAALERVTAGGYRIPTAK